jgi:type I restriction enzyme S subunit
MRTTLGKVTPQPRAKVKPQDFPALQYVGMEHIEAHTTRLLGSVPATAMKSATGHFWPGDVLYGRLRPYLNKVHCADSEGLCSSEFIVLPRGEKHDPKFLLYRLNSTDFVSFASSLNAGDRPRVDFDQISEFPVMLPPLPEQRRIVAEIEKQFTRLEAGVAALRRVQANLHRYRAAVLKAACEGQWQRLPVSKIGEAVTGSTPSTKDAGNLGSSLPFFKPTDLNAGYYVHEARQHLSEKGAKLARLLPERTVLVTCIGATIGKTGLARVACATNQQINALIVNRQVALPEWAYWCFVSPNGQKQIIENASATTLPILNKSRFENLELPVPPLAEQERIVAEVERRLSVVSELETVVEGNLKRATRLRQAILQKAFSGELV